MCEWSKTTWVRPIFTVGHWSKGMGTRTKLGFPLNQPMVPWTTSIHETLDSLTNHPSTLLYRKLFINKKVLFTLRESKREGERQRNINVWEIHQSIGCLAPLTGTWPTTQARALTGNRTLWPFCSQAGLNPLNHTSQCQKAFAWFHSWFLRLLIASALCFF